MEWQPSEATARRYASQSIRVFHTII